MDVLLRRPLLTVFVVALSARVLIVLLSTSAFGGWTIDDETYSWIAETRADGTYTTVWAAYHYDLFQKTLTFLGPLTLIYALGGPAPLAGQLFVAVMGSVAAVALVYLALRLLPRSFALFAGLIVALLPSQIFWSSVLLKDAVVWALSIAVAIAIWHLFTGEGRRWVVAAIALGVLMLAVGHARQHTLVLMVIALVVASTVMVKRIGVQRWTTTLALAAIVPWVAGMGLFGHGLVVNAGSLEERRIANAIGAESALVDIPERPADGSVGSNLAHLPRGIVAVLFEPTPWGWDADESQALRLARIESLLWYPLLALALAGLPAVLERRNILLFPFLLGGGAVLVYALTEGNLGTAYRHRGELVWVVALLAAAGLARIVARRREGTSLGSQPAKGGHGA